MSLPELWRAPNADGKYYVVAERAEELVAILRGAGLEVELQDEGMTDGVPPVEFKAIQTNSGDVLKLREAIRASGWNLNERRERAPGEQSGGQGGGV